MKILCVVFYLLILLCASVAAQTTEFTFQGSMKDGASPANGNYDFEFRLYDVVIGGTQHPTVVTRTNVAVSNGLFSVRLDFLSFPAGAFPGTDRFLEIRVRNTGGGAYTMLDPRQKVGSSPYALQSLNATTATNATQLGGVAANQYVVTTDPRMTDARPPTAGSSNYVQNGTALQATSNFNISGNGTAAGTLSASILNATTQYNLGGNRVLSVVGSGNLFAGVNAGLANTSGGSNAFFGREAGLSNTTGGANAFFGAFAGSANTTANFNAFFGVSAGLSNTTGNNNTFVGSSAGLLNTTGNSNTFVGSSAGDSNTTGESNAFFGRSAGASNTFGNDNSFFGASAGDSNTVGFDNAFFGRSAGAANTNGPGNSFFGSLAGQDNTTGGANSFFGTYAGNKNTTGGGNSFFGWGAGSETTTGSANLFFGWRAGEFNTTGSNNTIIGTNADVGSNDLTYATAIGADAVVTTSNRIQLGRQDGSDDVRVSGNLLLATLGAAGPTTLCRNVFQQVATCSSSLRYKTNVERFASGLSLINQLKPITFDWKEGGMHDLGLGAEDVAAIEPLLVTYNAKGEVEGVKYDRIGVVLVNAIKEQQGQLDAQQKEIAEQKDIAAKQQALIEQLEKRLEQLEKKEQR